MTTSDDLVAAAVRIATAATYGFLTTSTDQLETRVVQHLEVTNDATITFSTGPRTRKHESIQTNPNVSYGVFDAGTAAAATIYGHARIDHDPDRRQMLWVDDLAPFFPGGPGDDGFVLVTIEAERIEVWSIPDEMSPSPFGLSSMITRARGGRWDEPTGTHPGSTPPPPNHHTEGEAND